MNSTPAMVTNVESSSHEPLVTLDLEGELSATDMGEILEIVSALHAQGVLGVVLDFEAVTHLHYRAVRSLWAHAEQFRQAGGDIKLCGLSPYLKAIFRSVGAHEVFEFYADASEARVAFHSLGLVFS